MSLCPDDDTSCLSDLYFVASVSMVIISMSGYHPICPQSPICVLHCYSLCYRQKWNIFLNTFIYISTVLPFCEYSKVIVIIIKYYSYSTKL